MFNMSDDDSNSTQLEGKKLKNRGAHMDGQLLEIDKDAPALMEDLEIEEGQEYFTDRELQTENKKDREERLKKELNAARLRQLQLQKQQQQQQKIQTGVTDPNKKLDTIEQGVLQSQHMAKHKSGAAIETQDKQHKPEQDKHHQHGGENLRKTDIAAVSALLGPENVKNLNLGDDLKLADKNKEKSVPAKMVADVRGKEAGIGI